MLERETVPINACGRQHCENSCHSLMYLKSIKTRGIKDVKPGNLSEKSEKSLINFNLPRVKFSFVQWCISKHGIAKCSTRPRT